MNFVIYSDFNGVYNITPSSNTTRAHISTHNSEILSHKTQINWSPESVQLISQLLSTGCFDFIWHTTWNDGANICKVAEIMGLANLVQHSPANFDVKAKGYKAWTRWKADYIIAHQKHNPRPFVWIDDKAPQFWEDHVRGNTLAPSLVVQPNSHNGLELKHIIRILDWAKEHLDWNKRKSGM